MKRKDLIRLVTLLEIADNFVEPEHVYDRVAGRLGIFKIAVSPEESRASLIELIESGFAKAYWLGPGPQKELDGVPSPADFQKYYFHITEEGVEMIPIWRGQWPFDDEGDLLSECLSLIEDEGSKEKLGQ